MIFISADDKVAYYHAPKNGSRTMLGYLSLVKEPSLYDTYPQYFHPTDDEVYSPLRERVKRSGKHHYEDCAVPLVENEYKIAVKRDPIKRFISGYTNRVLHHRKTKDTPDIHTFIKNFEYYKRTYADIETHFRPQVQFLGKDPSIYTHIFDTSEMEKVRLLFESIYQKDFPNLRLQQGGNHAKIRLSSEEKEYLKNWYKEDYEYGWC